MEIKIDTTKDSAEHIQHMIDFLTKFISAQETQTTQQTKYETQETTPGLFGMFGGNDNSEHTPEPEHQEEPQKFNLEPY